MKLEQPARNVLHLHLACLLLGALCGAFLGNPNHVMLGVSLGSVLGTLVPGLLGVMSLRRKNAKMDGTILGWSAAVFDNKFSNEQIRASVEEIRGQTYGSWLGIVVGALIAGFALNAAALGILAGGLVGGVVFLLFSRSLS